MEILNKDTFGELVKRTDPDSIVALCLSLMKDPKHQCNNSEFWRTLLFQEYGIRSIYKDPRQEYIDRRKTTHKRFDIVSILNHLKAHGDETWVMMETYNKPNYFKITNKEIFDLGKLSNKFLDYQNYKVFIFIDSEIIYHIPDNYVTRRILSEKYKLEDYGY